MSFTCPGAAGTLRWAQPAPEAGRGLFIPPTEWRRQAAAPQLEEAPHLGAPLGVPNVAQARTRSVGLQVLQLLPCQFHCILTAIPLKHAPLQIFSSCLAWPRAPHLPPRLGAPHGNTSSQGANEGSRAHSAPVAYLHSAMSTSGLDDLRGVIRGAGLSATQAAPDRPSITATSAAASAPATSSLHAHELETLAAQLADQVRDTAERDETRCRPM